MYNPSTNKKFKSPVGRLAQVQAIQNYSRMIRVKPEYKASKVRLKRKSGGTTTKKFKCKVNKVKGSPIDCFDFSK